MSTARPAGAMDMSEWVQAFGHILKKRTMEDIIFDIHAALDGKEWSPDTLDEIAFALTGRGFEILSPDEVEEEE